LEYKRVLFVGLGGAGQRHLRIFKELLPPKTIFFSFRNTKKTPLLNSDFSVNRETTLEKKYNLVSFNSLEDAFESKPDLVVISTPTSLHYEVALQAAKQKIHIFIEKPFAHNLEDFIELYTCRKNLGGGVLLTEIHELDLCAWFFGLPDVVYCCGGSFSDIQLDVEDTAHLTLKYSDYNVQINLCFMQQKNRRLLCISGTRGFVDLDINGNELKFYDHDTNNVEILSDHDLSNDDQFVAQAVQFLDTIPSKSSDELAKAQNSLLIVEAAKQSMKTGAEIKIKTVI